MVIRFDRLPQPPVQRTDAVAPPGPAEKNVVQQTLGLALKKAGQAARAFGDSLSAQVDEARKAAAREQVAQIRERIRMLKSLILLFGGSKALLRELKQLAGQLAAAASVLKESGGEASAGLAPGTLYTERAASDAPEAAAPAGQPDDATLAAQVDRELASSAKDADPDDPSGATDAERPAPVFAFGSPDPQQAQRRADAELLEKALRELKALLAAAKAARRNRNDRDDQKRLKEIGEDLEQVEKALGQLNEPSGMGLAGMGISVRV